MLPGFGILPRSFPTWASSYQLSLARVARLADEQTALLACRVRHTAPGSSPALGRKSPAALLPAPAHRLTDDLAQPGSGP